MTLFGKILLHAIDASLLNTIPTSNIPTLFKSTGSSTIFVYTPKGLRNPIDSYETFIQYKFNLKNVLDMPPEIVDMLEVGETVNSTYIPCEIENTCFVSG